MNKMTSLHTSARLHLNQDTAAATMYRGIPSAQRSNLPVASDASARVLCLPIYPALGNFDVQRVIDVIRTARA